MVLAKRPLVCWTKTRLFSAYTPEEAAALYEAMLRDTIALAAGVPQTDLAIAMTPPDSILYFNEITPEGALLIPVEGGHLGEVMEQVFSWLFKNGYRKVIVMNSDGPSLPPDYLTQGFQLLDAHDVVIGPSLDGGYYMLGMKALHRPLFRCIAWSSGNAFEQSRQRASAIRLTVAETPPWYDVDRPADVLMLARELLELPPDRLAHTRRFFATCPPRG